MFTEEEKKLLEKKNGNTQAQSATKPNTANQSLTPLPKPKKVEADTSSTSGAIDRRATTKAKGIFKAKSRGVQQAKQELAVEMNAYAKTLAAGYGVMDQFLDDLHDQIDAAVEISTDVEEVDFSDFLELPCATRNASQALRLLEGG